MRIVKMSVVEDELEFDMWDGQFEFFGNSYVNGNVDGLPDEFSKNGYDETADLILTPITIEEAVQNVRARNFQKMNLKKKFLFSEMNDNVSGSRVSTTVC